MIKFLIADDHSGIRKNVKKMLMEEYASAFFFEAVNSVEVLEIINNELIDIIILDITMPGTNGFETLKQIRAKSINTPVVILSMHPEDQYAVKFILAGASGYINKNNVSEKLIIIVNQILTGHKYSNIPKSP